MGLIDPAEWEWDGMLISISTHIYVHRQVAKTWLGVSVSFLHICKIRQGMACGLSA